MRSSVYDADLCLCLLRHGQLILDHVLFLQEVTLDVRASLLNDARVRAAFLVTDAEDQTSFVGVPLRP